MLNVYKLETFLAPFPRADFFWNMGVFDSSCQDLYVSNLLFLKLMETHTTIYRLYVDSKFIP